MKKSYRLFALVLTLVMVLGLCLTGCGKKETVTVESLINDARAKATSSEGMAFDGTIGMDMSISMFGQNEDVSMDAKLHCDAIGDEIAHVTMDATMKSGEDETEQQSTESYVVKDGDKYIAYTNTDGTWYKEETETTGLLDVNSILTDKVIASATLEEKDNEYVVSGSIDLADAVETVGSMMDMDDMLGELDGIDFTKVPKASVVYHFDKASKDLTAINMDMSATMQGLFDEAINAMLAEYAGDSDTSEMTEEEQNMLTALMSMFKFECSRMVVNINNIVYGASVKVKLPDSVKDNAQEMPDYSSLYDDIDFGGSTEIANPMQPYIDLNEANEAIGFKTVAPEFNAYSLDEIYVISDEILELDYLNEDGAGLMFRKAKNTVGDISGDYNDYPETKTVSDWVDGVDLSVQGWSEDTYNLVCWNDGEYTYALHSYADLTQEQIIGFIQAIIG